MKPLTLRVLVTAACLLWGENSAVAQNWRGLRVTPESRCSPYLASDYSYPQSIEARIIESLGGIWQILEYLLDRALGKAVERVHDEAKISV